MKPLSLDQRRKDARARELEQFADQLFSVVELLAEFSAMAGEKNLAKTRENLQIAARALFEAMKAAKDGL